MIENFADWAETKFQLLCDEAGVVRNKSSQDRMGWDYLVEFERPRVPRLPHDRQPGSATARVQVKSKSGGTARAELKLSNALRLSQEPDPCFVVLMLRGRQGRSIRIFAREFDEFLIEQVLRRARHADQQRRTELNRIKIAVTFDPKHEHTDDLLPWLRQRTCGDAAEYATRKGKLNETVGKAQMVGTVTFKAGDAQALIDHAVGLPAEFEVTNVEMREQRFNVPAAEPLLSGKPSSFSLKAHPRKAKLFFTGANGRRAEFVGELRTMNLPGFSFDHQRTMFTSSQVTGRIDGNGPLEITYNFRGASPLSLAELRAQLDFTIAARSKVVPSIWVEGAGDLTLTEVELDAKDDPWTDWFDAALARIEPLARRADRPRVSLHDFGSNANALDHFVAGLSEGGLILRARFDGPVPSSMHARSIMFHAAIELGDSIFVYVVARPCVGQRAEGDEYRYEFGAPILVERFAKPAKSVSSSKLIAHFEKLVQRNGPGVITVAGGDWMQAIGGDVVIST